MKREPKIAIVIPNFNGKELLENCLRTIKANTSFQNYEIIVVDNGSTDGSVEKIRKDFPEVLLITNPQNFGFSKACNQGARLALERGADYVLFLNNDTKILTKNWLEELLVVALSDEKIGIVGPSITGSYPSRGYYPSVLSDLIKPKTYLPGEVDLINGAAFLVSKRLIEKIGLLDEVFSPFGFEDTDYFIRTRKMGFKIFFTPKVVIAHVGSATVKKIGEERRNYVLFIGRRNTLILIKKHFSILRFMWEVVVSFASVFVVRKDPEQPLGLRNIQPKKKPLQELRLLIKAIADAFRAEPNIPHYAAQKPMA